MGPHTTQYKMKPCVRVRKWITSVRLKILERKQGFKTLGLLTPRTEHKRLKMNCYIPVEKKIENFCIARLHWDVNSSNPIKMPQLSIELFSFHCEGEGAEGCCPPFSIESGWKLIGNLVTRGLSVRIFLWTRSINTLGGGSSLTCSSS